MSAQVVASPTTHSNEHSTPAAPKAATPLSNTPALPTTDPVPTPKVVKHPHAMRRANLSGTKLKDGRAKPWQVRIVVTSDTGAKSTKAFYGTTLKEAQDAAHTYMREHQRSKIQPSIKLGAYLDNWLEQFRPIDNPDGTTTIVKWQPKTYRAYKQDVENYIKPELGNIRLDQLRPHHIETLCTKLVAAGHVRIPGKVRTTLSAALTRAVKSRLIPSNPVHLADIPTVRKSAAKPPFTEDQFQQVLAAEERPQWRTFWILLASTGLRPYIEARLLTYHEIVEEKDGPWIYLNQSKTEQGLAPIPIEPQLHQDLLALRSNSIYVFANPETGKPYHERTIAERWYEALENAGIDRHQIHRTNLYELRHLFGRRTAKSLGKHNHQLLARLMRHSNVTTSYQYYVEAEREDIRKASQRINKKKRPSTP